MSTTSPTSSLRTLFCGFEGEQEKLVLQEWCDESQPDEIGLIARSNFLSSHRVHFFSMQDMKRMGTSYAHSFQDIPSRDLITKLYATEALALKMMEMGNKGLVKFQQYEFRKRRYYALLSFLIGFVRENRFEQIVFSHTPTEVTTFVLSALAPQLGLRTITLCPHPKGLLPFPLLAEKLTQWSTESLSEFLHKPQPGRTKPPFFSSLVYRVPNWFAHLRVPKSIPTTDQPYVYFPLEDTPESPTSPLGKVFIDQYYAILMIARALPKNWKVLVQESPHPKHLHRPPGFYQLLNEEENVLLAPPSANRTDLLAGCLAVATVTGLIGLAAAFRNKPAIVFGETFYRKLPGAFPVNGAEDTSQALALIQAGDHSTCSHDDLETLVTSLTITRQSLLNALS